jgi:hypothetical protein
MLFASTTLFAPPKSRSHTHTYTHTHKHTHTYTHTYTHTNTHTHTHTYIHTHTFTPTHTYIHTYTGGALLGRAMQVSTVSSWRADGLLEGRRDCLCRAVQNHKYIYMYIYMYVYFYGVFGLCVGGNYHMSMCVRGVMI